MERWWILLACIASLFTALTVFLDNYAVDVLFKNKSPFAQKIVYLFLHPIVIIIIAVFFSLEKVGLTTALLFVAVGALYSLALIPYYLALTKEDSTATEIFSQTEPIFCLLLGIWLLGEGLSTLQLISFILIILASFVTVAFRNKRTKKFGMRAILLTSLAAIIWAMSDLCFVAAGDNHDYATTLMYILIGRAIVDFIIVTFFLKKERKYCFKMMKSGKLKFWWVLMTDYVLEISSDLIYRFALLLAPMAIVSATGTATEVVFTFLLGLLLTLVWPKFGREKLQKRTILTHLIAIILLVIGIVIAR